MCVGMCAIRFQCPGLPSTSSRLWSKHMRRNVEGLKRSAQLRSEEARQRALVALSRMESSSREINFRTVAN